MQMEDKVVLVTGGASGLGRGISLVLAERGADAAVADIHLEGAEKVAEELAGLGRKSKAFQVDVTKQTELGQLVAESGDEELAAQLKHFVYRGTDDPQRDLCAMLARVDRAAPGCAVVTE